MMINEKLLKYLNSILINYKEIERLLLNSRARNDLKSYSDMDILKIVYRVLNFIILR